MAADEGRPPRDPLQASDGAPAISSPSNRQLERYSWQIDVAGFGESGQERLRAASVLVSRVGGLGGLVAYELAAAGVGRLVLAHAGAIRLSDLNRQLLMTNERLGESRVETAMTRLRELNPDVEVVAINENASPRNAGELTEQVDLVVDCAPLFEERYALNDAAVRQRKPLVECGMFDLEAQITTIRPGLTPCLRCLYPGPPPTWKRRFPVFGAVSGSLGCIAAMEAIKVIAGFGERLEGTLLTYDLRRLRFRQIRVERDPGCVVCGALNASPTL